MESILYQEDSTSHMNDNYQIQIIKGKRLLTMYASLPLDAAEKKVYQKDELL
jgi:hypothetical protein